MARLSGDDMMPKFPSVHRSGGRGGSRSLKDALSEAGLGGDMGPRRRSDPVGAGARDAHRLRAAVLAEASTQDAEDGASGRVSPVRSETVSDTPSRGATPATGSSVVSPPPWLRAARRGRWEARLSNTFGWLMTFIIAGSIIGLAGHLLGVPPPGLAEMQSARQ